VLSGQAFQFSEAGFHLFYFANFQLSPDGRQDRAIDLIADGSHTPINLA